MADKNNSDMKINASELVRVPKNRIGVVIGVSGSVRKQLEQATKTKIVIDSDTGEVEIFSTPQMDDPVLLWKARDIVKAMGRGFSPERAFKLLDDEYYFEVISLKEHVGENEKNLRRVKARIIGKDGRTREIIEEYTGCHVVISGNTVSIIGKYMNLQIAKDAVLMLINGSNHSTVNRFLQEKNKELRASEVELWSKPGRSREDIQAFDDDDFIENNNIEEINTENNETRTENNDE